MSSETGWRMVKAAEEGNLAQVTQFLRDSVPIDSITKFGISALVGASGFGRDEVVRALLQCNPPPSIDLLGDDHECALFKACANGHLKVVTLLLAAQPAPRIDLVSRDGTTPMMIACARCYPEIVAELLNVDKGQPNLNARNALQKTALHLAAFAGEISIVRMLLAAADAYGTPLEIDAQDADGMSAVMLAAKSNLRHAKEVLSFLLSSGANPNLQNRKSETALHLASESGNVDAVRALLESPQPVNTSLRDNLGQTALVCRIFSHLL
jgi:ankyrin repeat domain-containing protein 17